MITACWKSHASPAQANKNINNIYSSAPQARDSKALLSNQQWMELIFSTGSTTHTLFVRAGYLTSFHQIQLGYIFGYPLTMLSNNTYLICRKVRLRYSISTVCFEIPKGSILHSQWGRSKQCKRYVSLLEKHKYPSHTQHGGSGASDASPKSPHFPAGHRCSPFPRTRLQMSILSWSTDWVFSDGGMQSCCGDFCF